MIADDAIQPFSDAPPGRIYMRICGAEVCSHRTVRAQHAQSVKCGTPIDAGHALICPRVGAQGQQAQAAACYWYTLAASNNFPFVQHDVDDGSPIPAGRD